MELSHLVEGLSDPAAYPGAPREVEIRQTHISAVFLVGDEVFKIKKPVDLGFLDFTTLQRRKGFCEAEVRLNRRLAPDVYRGVLPVTEEDGRVRIGGDGPAVEYAVHMRRLPDDGILASQLRGGKFDPTLVGSLAEKIASFHRDADRSDAIAEFGRVEVAGYNAVENFDQTKEHIGVTVSPAVYDRFRTRTEEEIERLRDLIEARAAAGVPCDTHGDLHLEHVYRLGEEWVIVDCIEFNDRFRYNDPVADIAFLIMDLEFQGWRDIASALGKAYFEAAGDPEGMELLPFYVAYRCAVRAKVKGIECLQDGVPDDARAAARARSRAHWLHGYGTIESPDRRPCLILVGGLPGVGKSTLAASLAGKANFEVVRSDVVRKEMAGVSEEIYTPEWANRTYGECLRRSLELLYEGKRVIVDATFKEERRREAAMAGALRAGVPSLYLHCTLPPEEVRRRIEARMGDASDADWSIYQMASKEWEEPGRALLPSVREISTEGPPDVAEGKALCTIREAGLL